MNLFTIAGIVGILVIMMGVLFSAFFVGLSRMVRTSEAELEEEKSAVNPSVTLGYAIPVNADVPEQLERARKLAAARAAALPRGANMRIGRLGAENTRGAGAGVTEDPWTAVKIAAFHSWQGARSGPPVAGAAPETAAVQARAAAAPTKKPEDLKPGVDYEYTEVTAEMSGSERRQARIANAKARAAAIKALKQQGVAAAAMPPTAGEPGAPPTADAKKVSPAAPVATTTVPEPDYIEMTDDMPADEVRKARIHNARARSAYLKALKEAGVDPSQVTSTIEHPGAAPAATEESPKAATPAAPTPASGREAVAVPDDLPEPDYIEITDDMPADEVRKARIHNARARSQFMKELKARGIDPAEYEAQQAAAADAAVQASPPEAAAAPAAESAPAAEPVAEGTAVEIPAHIAPPDYVEITDDMSADEVRRARITNARERSRYFKELKEAGIDPKQVEM
ncbi:MAG: hypothetical protein R3272_13385 [Candidatus Promineifilaceae bacterium]|nr:hypothetical protein [Candidatus Promineifilaceae bacterium]